MLLAYLLIFLFNSLLILQYITEGNTRHKLPKAELVKMLSIATSQAHFLFNGMVFDEIDGVAMGSPLPPV